MRAGGAVDPAPRDGDILERDRLQVVPAGRIGRRAGEQRAPRVAQVAAADRLEADVVDGADGRLAARAQQHEDGRSHVGQRDAAEGHVRHLAAVDRLDRHRRRLRVLDRDVLEQQVAHRPDAGRAELQAVGDARAAHVVAAHDDVAQALGAAALEADAVVAGVDRVVLDQHVVPVDDVDAVVRRAVRRIDRDAADDQVLDLEIDHRPRRRVAHGDALDRDVGGQGREDRHRPLALASRHPAPLVDVGVAVDGASALDAHGRGTHRVDQRVPAVVELGVDRERLERRIVGVVAAAQQRRAGLDAQRDVAVQHDRAREEAAAGQHHGAALAFRARLDGSLQGRGVLGLPVADRTEREDVAGARARGRDARGRGRRRIRRCRTVHRAARHREQARRSERQAAEK